MPAGPDRVLGLAVQPGILDGEGGAVRQVLDHAKVGSGVGPRAPRLPEGDRAEDPVAGHQRDADRRAQIELRDELRGLGVKQLWRAKGNRLELGAGVGLVPLQRAR